MDYTIIEGPNAGASLNLNGDGPFAYSDGKAIEQYAATEWLYEYARDNVENHGGTWDMLDGWIGITGIYPLILEDENRDRFERELSLDDIGSRGAEILDATQTEDEFAIKSRFQAWRDEIQKNARAPERE